MQIENSVALVTGANRGLGLAIAEALAEAGARVYGASRSGAPIGRGEIVPLKLDVTDAASVERAAAAASDVTLLVNNAGVLAGGGATTAPSLDGARLEFETNFFGSLSMARAFAPVIAENGGGAIVNVGSILSHAPISLAGTYSASKAAVLSMTQSLRAELAPKGIRVLSLLPAFVDTDMAAGIDQAKMHPADVAASLLEGLRSTAEDVYPGPAAQFAASFRDGLKAFERQLAQAL